MKNYCLLVLTDRRTRHQIIRLIPNKSAEAVNQALKLILKQQQILSITADNGTEFNRLSDVFSEEHIYYAHPYASWERGTNENHNRLIRRWLPKGTKKTTPKEVAFIENWINNYPKKCLNYKSPREDFLMANLNLKFGVDFKKQKRTAETVLLSLFETVFFVETIHASICLSELLTSSVEWV
ncbi:transposase-like protein, IS1239 [Streptococcus pneumoniae]|uniref:Transposase-like protein, IS1239 n=1 Tax=Streptococcus pneumoniae TaxID=1313 RepID=A0A0B4ZIQ3_STREE|nr:Transposase, IS30 family [Streptococcus pneumoniae]EPD16724.1 transposase [Streptococcus pneumoniae MNZ41]EPF48626.1 transposase [Streptococcus pneumoniae MNZ85]CFA03256.1 transposase-like protein%2C IS1239 [Streptococcus pneumoniae]CKH92932.1 transposase-like protein%2C IS1239 [Streptococcus pneumoniae]